MRILSVCSAFLFSALVAGALIAQDASGASTTGQETAAAATGEVSQDSSTAGSVIGRAKDIGKTLNENDTVKEISAGLLQPIYDLAQYMAHPWFYWSAFAVMVAGVVSFVGQLVFTKFLLLFKFKLNFQEILSDVLGLLISVTGLVLVTQAATQNSTFTQSPLAVVSAAAAGAIVGFVFYLWGQKTEFQASRDKGATSNPTPKQDRRPTM